jgi:hypothetical protein
LAKTQQPVRRKIELVSNYVGKKEAKTVMSFDLEFGDYGKPTHSAQQHFTQAVDLAGSAARTNPDPNGSVKNIFYYMYLSLAHIAVCLKYLSFALRANYILLDKVNIKLGGR